MCVESNMIVVIGASVATFVVLLLLLGVFVIITLCLWRARMRKIKGIPNVKLCVLLGCTGKGDVCC